MLGDGASAAADACPGRPAEHPAAVGKAPRLLGRQKGAEGKPAVFACRPAWTASSGAGLGGTPSRRHRRGACAGDGAGGGQERTPPARGSSGDR